jgi:hypothetical protein
MRPQLQLIDPSFQSQSSEKCDLLLNIGTACISYAIISTEGNRLRILSEITIPNNSPEIISNKLEELIDENEHLKHPFQKVLISIDSNKFVFIPNEIYDQSKLTEYVKFLNPNPSDNILTRDLNKRSIKNVFTIDSYLQSKLLAHYPKAIITSQANPFIEGTAKNLKNDLPYQLFLNIQGTTFEASLYRNNELSFYNLIEYKTVEEFNYFLLAIITQFSLTSLETSVFLTGKINPGEELYTRIKKYFSKIKLADGDSLVDRNYIFHRVQPHTYFSLLSLTLCE